MIESLLQDARYAVRGMRRAPLFAASVSGTIGIGLGVLCSAFTIINAYLLKAVNLPDPHQLYGLSYDTADVQREQFSLADLDAIATNHPVLAHVAGGRPVTASREGVAVFGHLITPEYFSVMGATPALGRTLTGTDFDPTRSHVVVLSHEEWRTQFKAEPAIIGTEVELAGSRFMVVGVMPANAVLPGDEQLSFWTPLPSAAAFGLAARHIEEHAMFAIGRRRDDVSAAQTRAWFDTWTRQRFPPGSPGAAIRSRADSLATRIPLNRGTSILFSMLTAAFGLVLLVACANVTNMLLARGLSRQRELGVRLSLGAGRGRIMRQLLIESVVLAVPAAALGLALTYLTARTFPYLITTTIPAGAQAAALFLGAFDPDLRVVSMLIGAGVSAALFAGLSPALHLTRASLVDAMRGELGPGARISRVRSAFVAVQIATCVLFLVAAIGLAAESRRMAGDRTGLDHDRIIDVRVPPELREPIARQLAGRSEIEHVAAVWRSPLIAPMEVMRIRALPDTTEQNAGFMAVSPEYFATLGVDLRRGRWFSTLEAAQNAPVVVISEATAGLFWPGQDPIGQSIELMPALSAAVRQPSLPRATVIGVAEDVVNGTLLDGVARTALYFPTAMNAPNATRLLARTRGDAAASVRAIAAAVEAAHPTASVQMAPLQQRAAIQIWAFRAVSTMAVIPAVIGVLLSFAGTFGVVSFIMTQRTREFGIRMALGATANHIMRTIVGTTLRIAMIASALGLIATVGLIRAGGAVLGVRPVVGPLIYATGVAVVVMASVVAGAIPALRAIRITPSSALRTD